MNPARSDALQNRRGHLVGDLLCHSESDTLADEVQDDVVFHHGAGLVAVEQEVALHRLVESQCDP